MAPSTRSNCCPSPRRGKFTTRRCARSTCSAGTTATSSRRRTRSRVTRRLRTSWRCSRPRAISAGERSMCRARGRRGGRWYANTPRLETPVYLTATDATSCVIVCRQGQAIAPKIPDITADSGLVRGRTADSRETKGQVRRSERGCAQTPKHGRHYAKHDLRGLAQLTDRSTNSTPGEISAAHRSKSHRIPPVFQGRLAHGVVVLQTRPGRDGVSRPDPVAAPGRTQTQQIADPGADFIHTPRAQQLRIHVAEQAKPVAPSALDLDDVHCRGIDRVQSVQPEVDQVIDQCRKVPVRVHEKQSAG